MRELRHLLSLLFDVAVCIVCAFAFFDWMERGDTKVSTMIIGLYFWKSFLIGSDFNISTWIADGKKYTSWYFNPARRNYNPED